MERSNLYHVQDADRPMWVIAPNWNAALTKWKEAVATETEQNPNEVSEPQGIQLVCESNDLIC